MRTRNRNRDEEQRTQQPGTGPGGGTPGAASEDARRRAQRLLDQGDEAINNALSQDSERFLAHNRQQGGE